VILIKYRINRELRCCEIVYVYYNSNFGGKIEERWVGLHNLD